MTLLCGVKYWLRGSRTPVVLVNFSLTPSTVGATTSLGHNQKCRVTIQNLSSDVCDAATFCFPGYCSCAVWSCRVQLDLSCHMRHVRSFREHVLRNVQWRHRNWTRAFLLAEEKEWHIGDGRAEDAHINASISSDERNSIPCAVAGLNTGSLFFVTNIASPFLALFRSVCMDWLFSGLRYYKRADRKWRTLIR